MNDVQMMTWGWSDRGWLRVISFTLADLLPRHAQTSRHSFFLSKAAPPSSGQIIPGVTIAEGNSIHHTWETWCQTLYCRLFVATTASTWVPAVIVTLNRFQSCIGTAVERRNQDTPLAIRPTIMARHLEAAASLEWLMYTSSSIPCSTSCNRRNRYLMTLPRWGQKY